MLLRNNNLKKITLNHNHIIIQTTYKPRLTVIQKVTKTNKYSHADATKSFKVHTK